jgi:hypothetical protein
MAELVINTAMLERLGIANGKRYNPVPFVAFDTIFLGAKSEALSVNADSMTFFNPKVTKGDLYRNFTFDNKQAVVFTGYRAIHNAAFTPFASGPSDVKNIVDYFEKFSYINFGMNEKNIFNNRLSNLLPWQRVPENGSVITVEKEQDWVQIPYPLEFAVGTQGSGKFIPAPSLTLSAGGTTDASTPLLPLYPTGTGNAGGQNNASNYGYSLLVEFQGIRFVQAE